MNLRSSDTDSNFNFKHRVTRFVKSSKSHDMFPVLLQTSGGSASVPMPTLIHNASTCGHYYVPDTCKEIGSHNSDNPDICYWLPYICPEHKIMKDTVWDTLVTEFNAESTCCTQSVHCSPYQMAEEPCSGNSDHVCVHPKAFDCSQHTDNTTGLVKIENHLMYDAKLHEINNNNLSAREKLRMMHTQHASYWGTAFNNTETAETHCCKVPSCQEASFDCSLHSSGLQSGIDGEGIYDGAWYVPMIISIENQTLVPASNNPAETCCKVPTCGAYSMSVSVHGIEYHEFDCPAHGKVKNSEAYLSWGDGHPAAIGPSANANTYLDACCKDPVSNGGQGHGCQDYCPDMVHIFVPPTWSAVCQLTGADINSMDPNAAFSNGEMPCAGCAECAGDDGQSSATTTSNTKEAEKVLAKWEKAAKK